METIKVGRYSDVEAASHGWGGWIEPESMAWILFIPADNGEQEPEFFPHRTETGAVIEEQQAA